MILRVPIGTLSPIHVLACLTLTLFDRLWTLRDARFSNWVPERLSCVRVYLAAGHTSLRVLFFWGTRRTFTDALSHVRIPVWFVYKMHSPALFAPSFFVERWKLGRTSHNALRAFTTIIFFFSFLGARYTICSVPDRFVTGKFITIFTLLIHIYTFIIKRSFCWAFRNAFMGIRIPDRIFLSKSFRAGLEFMNCFIPVRLIIVSIVTCEVII